MIGLPRHIVHRVLLAGLLALSAVGARVALANAPSLDVLSSQALAPSGPAPLLGPITAVGRKGWECRPELAAADAGWQGAQLPERP